MRVGPDPSAAEAQGVRQRLRSMRLSLTASDPRVGPALDAARHRLADSLARESDAPPAVATALAALALGDFQSAERVIRALGASQAPDGRIPAGQALPPATPAGASEQPDRTPLYLLLLARYLAWTGDLHLVREEWPRVRAALAHRPSTADHPELATWASALQGLIIAAESIGEPAMAASLRDLSNAPSEPAALGASRGRHGESVMDQILEPDSVAAESVVDYLVRDILGVEPDAPKNRLRLRPRIPEQWETLDLTQLRFGDAEITMHYRRDGNLHRYVFHQESGAVPVRVIFEPLLPTRRLAAARVDGEAATLDPIPAGERLLVPVQIVLDDERRVELESGSPSDRARISLPVRRASD